MKRVTLTLVPVVVLGIQFRAAITLAQPSEIKLEAEYGTGGLPHDRSNASNRKTRSANVTWPLTDPTDNLPEVPPQSYTLVVRYSNDNPTSQLETVTIYLDDEPIGSFESVDTGPGLPPGAGWNQFQEGPVLGPFVVKPESQELRGVIEGGDGFGLEFDVLTLRPSPCILDLSLTYQDTTLTMDFVMGTDVPVLWSTWVFIGGSALPLWSVPLPPLPTVSFSVPIPGFPDFGVVGGVTVFSTTDGIVCWDFDTVDTGP